MNPVQLRSAAEHLHSKVGSLIASVDVGNFLRVKFRHQLKSLLRNGEVVAVDVAEWRNSATH